jgi:hypothetical protein
MRNIFPIIIVIIAFSCFIAVCYYSYHNEINEKIRHEQYQTKRQRWYDSINVVLDSMLIESDRQLVELRQLRIRAESTAASVDRTYAETNRLYNKVFKKKP